MRASAARVPATVATTSTQKRDRVALGTRRKKLTLRARPRRSSPDSRRARPVVERDVPQRRGEPLPAAALVAQPRDVPDHGARGGGLRAAPAAPRRPTPARRAASRRMNGNGMPGGILERARGRHRARRRPAGANERERRTPGWPGRCEDGHPAVLGRSSPDRTCSTSRASSPAQLERDRAEHQGRSDKRAGPERLVEHGRAHHGADKRCDVGIGTDQRRRRAGQ